MREVLGLSLMTAMLLVYFVGCSESGGSSSLLSFPSKAISAKTTIKNGVQVKNIVAQNQQSAYSILNSITNSNNQNMLMMMRKVNDIFKDTINSNSYALNAVVKEVNKCKNDGSVSITRNVFNNNNNLNLTMIFDNCTLSEEKAIVDGTIYVTAQNEAGTVTTNIKYITDLTLSRESNSIKIQKDSTMNMVYKALDDSMQNAKITINAIVHEGTKASGQQNGVYRMKNRYSFYQTSGKVYINNLASYVDYDTSYDMSKTPFVLDEYSITSGEARYNMENGGKVKIVAENNKAKVYIDKDGDGNYELSE